jgi:hypothetical protein
MTDNHDFDMQAAWLRRFKADAESNLKAFALRLKEAMPELVTVHESRSFFSGNGKITGVTVSLGDNRYSLAVERGTLKASVAMVVRGITLNTKAVDPSEWFVRLAAEIRKVSEHAQAVSRSLTDFMVG